MSIRREQLGGLSAGLDAVAQVRRVLSSGHADGLELDVIGAEVLEETAALPEQNRNQVDLDLVEQPGLEGALRRADNVDEHGLVAGRLLGPADRLLDVAQVGDAGPLGELGSRSDMDMYRTVDAMTDLLAQASAGILVGVGAVYEAFQIAVCALITIACLASLVVVWRDDHKWTY